MLHYGVLWLLIIKHMLHQYDKLLLSTLGNLPLDSNIRPTYNLIELGLEDYEENELVLDTIHDLMLFFQENKCNCKTIKIDLRTCYEKVKFKQFFERHLQLCALDPIKNLVWKMYGKTVHEPYCFT